MFSVICQYLKSGPVLRPKCFLFIGLFLLQLQFTGSNLRIYEASEELRVEEWFRTGKSDPPPVFPALL